MNQLHTPLYSALVNHLKKDSISYHVPGHKSGGVFPEKANPYFQSILNLDLTEISGLDDLHDPEGVIFQAQQLTAQLYGVKESYFLVNGSTVGNIAMILATCSEGDIVLVQRNSHKSIINGLQLAGVKPVFLAPEYDSNVKVASSVSEQTVKEALTRYPKAKALILTNPNYYGMAANLSRIVKLAHENGTVVLVDEAHGAHFVADLFPTSAIKYGADIVVQSAHKTLPAMTMGSYIHYNSKLVSSTRLKHYLQMLQSSSPSYPIMASLDLARSYLATLMNDDLINLKQQTTLFKEEINQIEGIKVVQSTCDSIEQDLLKVVVQTESQLSGYELQKRFEDHGIYTELADLYNVLFVIPLGENKRQVQTIKKVKDALRGIRSIEEISYSKLPAVLYKISELEIGYKELKGYNKKVVPIKEAVGKVAAEMVIPYPPGVPMLVIGEKVTDVHIEMLIAYRKSGARFQGSVAILQNSLEVFL